MTDNDHDAPFELPVALPIFPLSGVLLLPDARLPLNVFEPRYLNMVEDALGNGRVIGVVQPREPVVEESTERPPIYDIGCLGRIVSFAESGDGRLVITLLGISRFHVWRERRMVRGYRSVDVSYTGFAMDLDEDESRIENRTRLLECVKAYFRQARIKADWSAIETAGDGSLVASLSMLCPFDAGEKQALLECPDTRSRSELLVDLMVLAIRGGQAPTTTRH